MDGLLSTDQRREFLARGFNRRDLGRLAALFTAGAALPFYNESALAQGLSAMRNLPPDAVRINSNENPMGPCPEAVEAICKLVPQGGRYLYNETFGFIEALAGVEGLPQSHVMPFAGSSDPLHRAVLAFCSPTKGFITGDPGYEAGEKAAEFVGAKVARAPMRKDGSQDVRAMLALAQAGGGGLIYLCNPNNPTGSITTKDDVDYLVANAPEGTLVLLDEAYIHLSDNAVPGTPHVAADKNVLILRTFSKLYGMAGLRAGAALARPDILDKLKNFGAGALPATGMVGATASLKVKDLVPRRRAAIKAVREENLGWLDKKGFACLPTEANMFMVDVRRPGREVFDALLKEKVVVGRTWPSMPTHVRVTVGTREEMAKFRDAFGKVMGV